MATFTDFNFKLLVIDDLMYFQEVIVPPFDIAEALKADGVTDPWQYAVDSGLPILEQARAYFEALDLPAELLAQVDTLTLDGGLQIYHECAPAWDGEDDRFDIHSLADVDLLPNLATIEVAADLIAVPGWRETLTARGIDIDE